MRRKEHLHHHQSSQSQQQQQQPKQMMKASNTDEEDYGSFYTTNPIRSTSSISSSSSGGGGGNRYKYRDYSPNRRHHQQHHQSQGQSSTGGLLVDGYSIPQSIISGGSGSDRGSDRGSNSGNSRGIYARSSPLYAATGASSSGSGVGGGGLVEYGTTLQALPPPCCHQYYHHSPASGGSTSAMAGHHGQSQSSNPNQSPLHFNTIPHPPLQYRDAPTCSTLTPRSTCYSNRRQQTSPFTTYYATPASTVVESPYADPRSEIYFTSTLQRHPRSSSSSIHHHRYNSMLIDNNSPASSTILEGTKLYEPPPPPIGYQSNNHLHQQHHYLPPGSSVAHHHQQQHPSMSMRTYVGYSPSQQQQSSQSASLLRLDEARIYSSSALQLGTSNNAANNSSGNSALIHRSNSPPPLPQHQHHHPNSSASSASHHHHPPTFIDRSISLIRLDNSGMIGPLTSSSGIDSNNSVGTRIKFITDLQPSSSPASSASQQTAPSNCPPSGSSNSNSNQISSSSLIKTAIELGSSSDPLCQGSQNSQITPVKPKFKITDITPLPSTSITNNKITQSFVSSSTPIVEMFDKGVMTTQLPEQWSLLSSGSNSGSEREQQQQQQQRRISLGGTINNSSGGQSLSIAAPVLSGGVPDLLPTSCIVRHSGGDYGPSSWRNSGNNLLPSPRRNYLGSGSGGNSGRDGCNSGSGQHGPSGSSSFSNRGIPKHLTGGAGSGIVSSNYHQYQHRQHGNSKWDVVKQYLRNEMKTFFGLVEGGEDLKEEWLSRRKRFASRRYSERNVDSMPPPSPYQPTHDQPDGIGGRLPGRMVHHPRQSTTTSSTRSASGRSKRTRKKDHVFVVYWNLIRWLFWALRFGRTGQRVAAGAGCGSDTNPGSGSTTPGRVPLDSQMSRNRTKSRSITPYTLSDLPPNVTISPQELFFDDLDDNPRNSSHQLQPPGRGLHWRIARHQGGGGGSGGGGIGLLVSNRVSTQLLSRILDNSERQQFRQGLRQPTSTITKLALIDEYEDFRPYFTYWVSIVQVIILIVSMITYGLAPIGFDLHRKSSLVLVTSLSLQQMEIVQPANFWIGPSAGDLIHLGAKYAPCMRRDEKIYRRIMETRDSERQTACCIRNDNSGCVQSSRNECSIKGVSRSGLLSTWKKWTGKEVPGGRISGSVCGLDPKFCEAPASIAPYEWPDDITKWPICRKTRGLGGMSIKDKTAEHMVCEVIGHPCCIGIHARCVITTREYCRFVSGYFHEEASLCSQVSCLQDVCGMFPFLAYESPDQFYRLFSSLFLHAGLIHICFTLLFHWFILRDLEKLAGPLRISIIYLGSGFAGNLGSVLLEPHRAEVGPGGGQYGLIACLLVELLHMWGMLRRPWQALGKMVIVTGGLFLLGFLPWVDNFAHVVGFAAGFLLSHALMPYIAFGKYSSYRKWLEVLICLGGFFTILVTLLIVFYAGFGDCEMCRLFNCLPFTQEFCAEQEIDLKPSGTGINFIT